MFPLRDAVRPRSRPYVTWGLILFSLAAFALSALVRPAAFESLVLEYGLVPARLSYANPASWLTLVTSIFLHGGWFHVISNLWTLFIFGDNVEDRMGHFRFLAFYLVSGVVAGLAHVLLAPTSALPTIGASGAIAGVLGAYFVLYPSARVLTLVPLIFIPWLVEIPAFIYLGIWFLSQLSSVLLNLGAAGDFGGIAWWAHIGGFAFGALAVLLIMPRLRKPPAMSYQLEDPFRDNY
ncbi:MAG: rhomboid family intramembrane serine protease [Chloroflexi bacterium]|nr:rhomboid family intramembrane serine protease [Chloroflexota bacterium]